MARRKPIDLSEWMEAEGLKDDAVASKLSLSRVQVSRLRRKINGASVPTARKLESLTGIPWHSFLSPERVA